MTDKASTCDVLLTFHKQIIETLEIFVFKAFQNSFLLILECENILPLEYSPKHEDHISVIFMVAVLLSIFETRKSQATIQIHPGCL